MKMMTIMALAKSGILIARSVNREMRGDSTIGVFVPTCSAWVGVGACTRRYYLVTIGMIHLYNNKIGLQAYKLVEYLSLSKPQSLMIGQRECLIFQIALMSCD